MSETTTIAHTLPTGETIDFLVEVDLEHATAGRAVFVSYATDIDLSRYKAADAYPVAEIDAYVSRVAGEPLRSAGCFHWGDRDGGVEEGWSLEPAE